MTDKSPVLKSRFVRVFPEIQENVMRRSHLIVGFTVLLLVAGRADAVIIFDSFDGGASAIVRVAGSAPGTFITSVAQPTTITNISVLNNFSAAGQLRFLIFNHPGHIPLFVSSPQNFAADIGSTWKMSAPFSFTLMPGLQYDIGAISNVSASWNFDNISNSQNGIMNTTSNPNFSNFAFPTADSVHGGADAAVRLHGVQTQPIPEPATFAVWSILGMCGVGAGCWRRRRKTGA